MWVFLCWSEGEGRAEHLTVLHHCFTIDPQAACFQASRPAVQSGATRLFTEVPSDWRTAAPLPEPTPLSHTLTALPQRGGETDAKPAPTGTERTSSRSKKVLQKKTTDVRRSLRKSRADVSLDV